MGDLQFTPPFKGRFDFTRVTDPNGAPSDILEASQPFDVEGTLWVEASNLLDGDAKVTVYADQLGGPFDGPIGSVMIPLTGDIPSTSPQPWTVTVVANTLQNAPLGGGNIYKLAAVLEVFNSVGTLLGVSALEELPGLYRIS